MCIRYLVAEFRKMREEHAQKREGREGGYDQGRDATTSMADGANGEFEDGGPGLLGTLFPFIYFPCDTSESRHAYMENLFNSVWGKVLTFLPFILVMAIGCNHIEAAVWSAFGTESLLILCSIYRSRYNDAVPAVMILDGGLWVGFLGQGIAIAVTSAKDVLYNCALVSPINTSVLFGVTLLSMIVCVPFTIQFARSSVPPDVAKSERFLKANMILTSLWLAVFGVMCISSWCGYVYFRDNQNGAGYIILATVIPICAPIAGSILTSMLVDSMKKKAEKYKQSTTQEGGQDLEEGQTGGPVYEQTSMARE